MSAYMVDREHIHYLIEAAMSRRIRGPHNDAHRWWHGGRWLELPDHDRRREAEVGQMLWDENRASIRARYPDTDHMPGPVGENYVYGKHSRFPHVPIDPVQVLKACDCFAYQACEHDGWNDSEAKAFIDALTRDTWHALTGYDAAEWGAPLQCYAQKQATA